MLHADGRTDMKLIVTFHKFCERIYRMIAKVPVHLLKNGAALCWKRGRFYYNKNM